MNTLKINGAIVCIDNARTIRPENRCLVLTYNDGKQVFFIFKNNMLRDLEYSDLHKELANVAS